jgi:hypothetical protein
MAVIHHPPYEQQFVVIEEFPNGGILRRHILVNENYVDYEMVYLVGWEKALLGNIVDIMPILTEKDSLREVIYHDSKLNKCPDLRINGTLCEVENPQRPRNKNNLKRRISDGARQADVVIVHLIEAVDINIMRAACKGRFIDHSELAQIEFREENGDYRVFIRTDFDYEINEPII